MKGYIYVSNINHFNFFQRRACARNEILIDGYLFFVHHGLSFPIISFAAYRRLNLSREILLNLFERLHWSLWVTPLIYLLR